MYNHAYHQCLTYKIFCARKPDIVVNSFEQCLAHIRAVHRLSGGIKQIVYLAGWQYDGHDSRYPAWFQVNKRLKRDGDETARDSLLWLFQEAKQYNAVVSLHINMCDAYTNSPLWEEYRRHDLIRKDENGRLIPAAIWDGEQSYHVCKTREWQTGFAQKRIDRLLQFLPIAEAGTIHIDVFTPFPSPGHGTTVEQEHETLRRILHYWRRQGVDVTKEWYHHEHEGLVPMVYHLNLDEHSRLRLPPDRICGGGSAWNTRRSERRRHGQLYCAPEGGCLYEEAWGRSIDRDFHEKIDDWFPDHFARRTVPWLFLNRCRARSLRQDAATYEVRFDDDLTTCVRHADRHLTIRQRDRLLQDGDRLCLPAVWLADTWFAYSTVAGECRWPLPDHWQAATITRTSLDKTAPPQAVHVIDGIMHFHLGTNECALLRPRHT